jgi:type I restriction enzyme S subunit
MVEWKKLGEVCTFNRGRTITAKDAVDGSIPVIAGGQTPSYYHNEANRGGESITVAGSGAYAGFISYWNQPIFVSDAFTVDPTALLKHKYLFHWLKHNQAKVFATQKGAGVPHVHGKDIANFLIPIPSIEEQNRIVGILDTFTASIDNLKEQIAQRRKQYEYYRDQLLDLEGKPGVKMKSLEELVSRECSLSYGIVQPGDDVPNGIPVVRPVDLVSMFVGKEGLKKTTKEISDSYKRTILKGNEILFCVRGTTGVMSLASEKLKDCNVTRGIVPITIDDKITKMFVYYQLKGLRLQKTIAEKTNGTALRQINVKDLRLLSLMLPSLHEQQRIVSILDTFEASIQNLEAQLSQREKQYEYYRNKLLTFE